MSKPGSGSPPAVPPAQRDPRSNRERLQVVLANPLATRPNRNARLERERVEIGRLLDRKAKEVLRERLAGMHHADIAEYLEDRHTRDVQLVLSLCDDETSALVLGCIEDEDLQLAVARALGADRLSRILEEMPSDEVVDLLARFDPDELGQVLEGMDADDAEEVRELLLFDEESAGGLMEVELLRFGPEMTGQQMIELIRERRDELETVNYLYLTDPSQVLAGVISLRQLMLADPEQPISEYMERDVIRVHLHDDQEEVAQLVMKYDLLALPVVDDSGVLKGIVTVDDILDVLEEEATEDMFGMAGLDPDEAEEESATRSAMRRLPWLLATLFGACLSGWVLRAYSPTLDRVVALVIFIPAIMGLGGNIAVQSSTLVVRGFATGDLDSSSVGGLLWKEVRVGVILGLILGAAAGGLGYLFIGNPGIGLVVAVSMTGQFTMAAANGTFIPYVLHSRGFDPALAAGPFVTMVSDLTGLLIYFGLANALMDWLV
jgi:magnesium transporter